MALPPEATRHFSPSFISPIDKGLSIRAIGPMDCESLRAARVGPSHTKAPSCSQKWTDRLVIPLVNIDALPYTLGQVMTIAQSFGDLCGANPEMEPR